jgi:hypothetical protein
MILAPQIDLLCLDIAINSQGLFTRAISVANFEVALKETTI